MGNLRKQLQKETFHVVLFIVIYNVVLTFEPSDRIQHCDYSSESYCVIPREDEVRE